MIRLLMILVVLVFQFPALAGTAPEGPCETFMDTHRLLTNEQRLEIIGVAQTAITSQSSIAQKYTALGGIIINAIQLKPVMEDQAPATVYFVRVGYSISPAIIFQVLESTITVLSDDKGLKVIKDTSELSGS